MAERTRTSQRSARVRAGTNPSDPRAWRLERYIASRTLRHLRAVGDAMVWTALGCARRVIMSYAGNASPGPLNKAGLEQEKSHVEQAWAGSRDEGRGWARPCLHSLRARALAKLGRDQECLSAVGAEEGCAGLHGRSG